VFFSETIWSIPSTLLLSLFSFSSDIANCWRKRLPVEGLSGSVVSFWAALLVSTKPVISVYRKFKKIDQFIFRNAKEIYFNEKFPIL
jgi:hypothetical protein